MMSFNAPNIFLFEYTDMRSKQHAVYSLIAGPGTRLRPPPPPQAMQYNRCPLRVKMLPLVFLNIQAPVHSLANGRWVARRWEGKGGGEGTRGGDRCGTGSLHQTQPSPTNFLAWTKKKRAECVPESEREGERVGLEMYTG